MRGQVEQGMKKGKNFFGKNIDIINA